MAILEKTIGTSCNKLCFKCIDDEFLSDLVKKDGELQRCSYCQRTESALELGRISSLVEGAFSVHFFRTPTEPTDWERAMESAEKITEWSRKGKPTSSALQEASGMPNQAAKDVQKILSAKHFDAEKAKADKEYEFSEEAYYNRKMPSSSVWDREWRRFERLIGAEARYFSASAAAQLRKLFDPMDEMRTTEGNSPVVTAGPSTDITHVYRARVFDSQEHLEEAMKWPNAALGPPPTALAKAGRMNAHGVSVFYGATEANLAILEVRPPVGSHVAIARFRILRSIQLLDLEALRSLQETGSVFDPTLEYRLGRMDFLRRLSYRISQPVVPSSEETEFLPTQVIADFLATEGKARLDGILYSSAQTSDSMLNVALFHKAARTIDLDVDDQSYFIVHHPSVDPETGPTPDYGLFHPVSGAKNRHLGIEANGKSRLSMGRWQEWAQLDDREDTLEIDLHSIEVHEIKGVQYEASRYKAAYWEFPFGLQTDELSEHE